MARPLIQACVVLLLASIAAAADDGGPWPPVAASPDLQALRAGDGRIAEPLADPSGRPSLREAWLERVGAGRRRAPTRPGAAGSPPTRPASRALDLVGANLPISTFADDVMSADTLDRPSLAYDFDQQRYLVVWQARSPATDFDVFGRIVSRSGAAVSPIFPISTDAGMQVAASAVYDYTADQFLVAWTDFGTGGDGSVRLRRYSSQGTPIGGAITVNSPGTSGFAGRIGFGGGRCVVAWLDDQGGGNGRILARAFDSSGTPATAPVALSETGIVGSPDLAYATSSSTFLVVWDQGVGGWWDVVGVGASPALALTPRMTISAATGHQRYPRVAYSSKCACFLAVWQDGRSQTSWDVWGQRMSAGLLPAGANFAIYAGTFHEYEPTVAGLATTSQFAVAYATDRSGGGMLMIHACLVSGFGGVVTTFPVREWHNQRRNPSVVGCYGADEYLVAWTEDAYQTTSDILGRVVDTFGNAVTPQAAIALGRKGQEAPALAYSPAHDQYLLVWMDFRNGADYQIWGRRVSGTGQVVGSELAIGNEPTSALYGLPTVAYNPATDEYLVVWHELHSRTSGYDVYARRVRWDGTFAGAPFLVSRDSGAGHEGTPRVAYSPGANEFLVGWNAFDDRGSLLWRVWGQRVGAAGALAGSGFLLSASNGACSPPRLAANPEANEVLAIWEDFRDQNVDIWGQRVRAGGGLAGDNLRISTRSGSKQGFAAAWTAGTYLVVWGDTTPDEDVVARRLGADGAPSGAEFPVAAQAGLVEAGPWVAADGSRGFLVGWQQPGTSTDLDVWGRRVPAADPPAEQPFALTTAADAQEYVELAAGGAGSFLFTWQDARSGGFDVYGQLYRSGCSLVCSASVPTTGEEDVPVAFAGSATATGCSGALAYDWDWGDGSPHGSGQNASHTYTAAGTSTWRLTVSAGSGESCSRTGTITISGPSVCTLSCSASVAASGAANVPLTFSGSALVGGCSSPVGYDWDWGDGTPHGATQDASHAYAEGGTYTWRMTATAGTATCSRDGTVEISGTRRLWVPVVSRATGWVGGWRSDLGILNRSGSNAAHVALTMRATGRTLTGNVTVPASGQEILRDVALLLGLDSGSGSLELAFDQPVVVTSRTYNLQEGGWTFGQGYDAIAVQEGLAAGQSAFLPQLTQNGSSGQTGTYRSNIGITNLGTDTARITVDLFDSLGVQVWTNTRELAPGQWHQYNEPFRNWGLRNDITKGYARITVVSGTSVFAYGSVLDNGSSDPTTIVMRPGPPPPPSGPSVSWVPVVSHAGGHVGGWRSDVGILNRSGTGAARVSLTLRSGGAAYTGTVTVPDGAQEILRDAAMLLGLASGSGSLELVSDRPVIVTSRTFNLQDSGMTYGQGYDGCPVTDGLEAGQSALLPQLTQNGVSGQAGTYRTNIGITNLGAVPARVTLVLHDGSGAQVYSVTRELAPGEWYQYNEPYRNGAQRNDIAKGYGTIAVGSGSGVIAYASVIDNGSSDPTTIMMKK